MKEKLEEYAIVYENESLKKYNTFRLEATAKYIIYPHSVGDLIEVLKILRDEKIEFDILGNGSNIILKEGFYDKAFIKLDEMNGIEVYPDLDILYAEAGATLYNIVLKSLEYGLTGLEFAHAIPASLGGAITGNAGAYNACVMDYVVSVTVLNKNYDIKILEHEKIEYGYRYTQFKGNNDYIILAAKFYLRKGDKENSLAMIKDRRDRRLASQPLEYPSAGSVFRNPEGDYAGRLIESCGLKGYRIGGAMVSEKHANFIINYDHATPDDIRKLINYVHDVVLEKTKVDLIIEQEFLD